MKRNNKIVLLIVILTFVLIVLGYLSNQNTKVTSQSKKETLTTAENSAFINGVVNGQIPPICPVNFNSVDSIFSQPLPKIWLEFPKSKQFKDNNSLNNKIEFQPEVETVLEKYWLSALTYRYNEWQGFSSNKEYQKQSLRLMKLADETKIELQKITINTPFEKRRISEIEAANLVTFVSKSADEIISKIKENDLISGC